METPSERYERAKKRVEEIKGFYKHLRAYIIINLLLILLANGLLNFITFEGEPLSEDLLRWMNYNFIITPVLWGVGLAIHGIYVYRHKLKFLKNWEEREIQKYLKQEEDEAKKFRREE